jgi:asparagine synthase (glutamine-hydrolysing)
LSLDQDALSQSVHFRWLTGEKRLFQGIAQALPGTFTHIDSSGVSARDSFFCPAFARQEDPSRNAYTRAVDRALDECLSKIARKHERIGIPLSGGVDSSLLLAKARDHFKECVAVSGRFPRGQNPELDNAVKTAKTLKVRHIVTDIDDQFVQNFFPVLVRLHEQPPRNFSDIALAKVLETLSHEVDAFLYGEAADTYFGTSYVHSLLTATKRAALFHGWPRALQKTVGSLIPSKPRRYRLIRRILTDGLDALILSDGNIEYHSNPARIFSCSAIPPVNSTVYEDNSLVECPAADRASIHALSTGVMNHVENTGRLASYFDMHMYVPFLLDDLRAVGERLPLSFQKRDGDYKPILRDLLCRYLDRSIVYSRKLGFPTPTLHWLDDVLKERVERCRNGNGDGKYYYTSDGIASLSLERDMALIWYAICLDEICSHSMAIATDPDVTGPGA